VSVFAPRLSGLLSDRTVKALGEFFAERAGSDGFDDAGLGVHHDGFEKPMPWSFIGNLAEFFRG
jgi:hypothetical protein